MGSFFFSFSLPFSLFFFFSFFFFFFLINYDYRETLECLRRANGMTVEPREGAPLKE